MKFIIFVGLGIVILPLSSYAQGSSSGGSMHSRWMVSGYYGLSFVNPKDINDLAAAQNTTPALNKISTGTLYGGFLGFMLTDKVQLRAGFDAQTYKNSTNTTTPSISGAGFAINQNEIWGGLNYFFVEKHPVFCYLGADAGYPTYSHLTATLSTTTEYDADKTFGFDGHAGLGFLLGDHIAVIIEGGYQYIVSGDIKTSGTAVKAVSGSNAKIDLSGGRAQIGLGIMF